jgi:hypothetical protein
MSEALDDYSIPVLIKTVSVPVPPPRPTPPSPLQRGDDPAPVRRLTEAELQERTARINSQLANPPPGPRPQWRDHVNSEGIIAPWFNPHG